MSRVATWDNSDQGGVRWWRVPGMSGFVPWQTWDNSDLGLAGWCKVVGGSRDPGCP